MSAARAEDVSAPRDEPRCRVRQEGDQLVLNLDGQDRLALPIDVAAASGATPEPGGQEADVSPG
jgi:hypothetical protein